MMDMCRDAVGQGVGLEIERLKRWQGEETKRAVMGKSPWRMAPDMKELRLSVGV